MCKGHYVSGIAATKRQSSNIGSCLNIGFMLLVFMGIRLMPGTEIQYMTSLLRSINRLQTALPLCHTISVRFRVCHGKSSGNIHLPRRWLRLDPGYGPHFMDLFSYITCSSPAADMSNGTGTYTPSQGRTRAGAGWPPHGNPSTCW